MCVQEVRNKRGDSKAKILDNMWLIATKNKAHIDKALSSLGELAVQEVNCCIGYVEGVVFTFIGVLLTAREVCHSLCRVYIVCLQSKSVIFTT